MPCFANLDLSKAAPPGSHLSFYWNMDEGGTADRIDSTVGNHWPTIFGASGTPGLFVNGVNCVAPVIINQDPGLNVPNDPAITIIQAISKGFSVWFWIKYTSFGTGGDSSGVFVLDTPDPLHTNRVQVLFGNNSVIGASIEIDHTNDTNDFFYDSPNVIVPLNVWQMYAVTYDKVAQTLNGYVNGVLGCTGVDTGVYPDLASGLMKLVNGSVVGSGASFILDELGLALNGPLTAAQVTALYNGGAGVTWPSVKTIVPYP